MLKYFTKFAMEIVPSVVATVLGAYIVSHYITPKSDVPRSTVATAASAIYAKVTGSRTDTPKSHASKSDSSKSDASKSDASTSDASTAEQAKLAETSAEISNIPGPGIKAKGIAEKSILDKAAAEKPTEVKPAEVKPTETASLPAADTPRHAVSAREKLMSRSAPADTPSASEERRDAADLARAAIERLRASEGPRSGERAPAAPASSSGIAAAAPSTVSPVRPLPPPITISTPTDSPVPGAPANPSYTGSVQANGRLTPPAEIPAPPPARPLDLRADNRDPSLKDQMSNVADDMLSAAKSVFHSVLPK